MCFNTITLDFSQFCAWNTIVMRDWHCLCRVHSAVNGEPCFTLLRWWEKRLDFYIRSPAYSITEHIEGDSEALKTMETACGLHQWRYMCSSWLIDGTAYAQLAPVLNKSSGGTWAIDTASKVKGTALLPRIAHLHFGFGNWKNLMILENNQAHTVVLNCRFSGVTSSRTDSLLSTTEQRCSQREMNHSKMLYFA